MSAQPTSGEDHGCMVRNLLRISCDDVRRPLWVVRTAAEVLMQSPRLSAREQEIVSSISRNAERVDATFRLLLDRAVATTGPAMSLEKERCSIAEIVEEAIAVVRADIPDRTFRHSPGSGYGKWDRGRMVQLLTGVLAHADEYGVAGAGAHLSWQTTGGFVAFTATIAPAIRGADTVGLRLAIARDIARAHGGDLQVRLEASGRLSISVRAAREP